MKLPIGCTTRPFGNAGFSEIFGRIAATGVSDIAVFRNIGIDANSTGAHVKEIRSAAEGSGLRITMLLANADLTGDDAISDYWRQIDQAAALGATWLLDLGTSEPAQLAPYIELMNVVAPYAADAGIAISAKPHGGITQTTEDLIALRESIDHPAFGICYDPGNIIYYAKGAERPETNVRRVAPIVTTGIIKDCILNDGEPDVMITPGEGLVDFKSVLDGLIEGGFSGPLYIECVGGTDPKEVDANVRDTVEFIQSILSRRI